MSKKCMAIRTHWPYISLSILTFSNGCILLIIGSIYTKLGDFVKLGVHFMTIIYSYPVLHGIKSGNGIWKEQAKEWEVFRYRMSCFSELQNTTYTESTVLLIFPKDEVRKAHCLRFVRIHRPNCKAMNDGRCTCYVPSISNKVAINGSRNTLQWRCLN